MQNLFRISSTALTGATLATLLVLGACSKFKDLNPVDPPGLGVHPAGWVVPDSATFHGKHIKDSGWNLAACQECHGIDYKGGIADKSCLTCHPGTPEACVVCHGGTDNSTGAPPEDLQGLTDRQERGVGAHTVHMEGNIFTLGVACETCHRVPADFGAPGHIDSSEYAEVTFGGLALADGASPQWDGQTCQNTYCHGSFEDGTASNAPMWTQLDGSQAACGTCHGIPPGGNHPAQTQCSTCHSAVIDANFQIIDKTLHINGVTDVDAAASHPAGWLDPGSPNFHGLFIRNSSWDLEQCQQCHGADYDGGDVGVTCLSCHPQTPEGCVVCHGGVDSQTGAPPEDIDGNETPDAVGVGAHTIHLSGGDLSTGFECTICHTVPAVFNSTGHADSDLPAELHFGGLALAGGASPQWNGQTCQNTYCHGSFEDGNASNAPAWTQSDGSQAACGTCHGLPPGGSHPTQTQCSTCHSAVIDANFQIIDKTLHINGVTDVDAAASHPAGWLDPGSPNFHGLFIRNSSWDLEQCQQCHGADYGGGNVGVTCLSCHPQTPEGCVVCHGGVDSQTGAPPEDIDGNETPDAVGVGAHTIHLGGGDLSTGFDCEICHTVPAVFNSTGHADSDLPAELHFGGLALADGASPQWDGQTCQNTYCHGSFEQGNTSNAPRWTQSDGSQAACGTCHGLPPSENHPTEQQCNLCHPGVVDANNRIIDRNAHIDGSSEIDMSHHDDLFFPIFSGEHRGEWDDCSICHVNPDQWTDFSCLGCHKHRRSEMEKEHDDVSGFVYESRACYACHPDGKEPDDD